MAPYYIPSASMEPTLHGCPGCDNDHVLVDKFSYNFENVSASDIVVFDRPAGFVAPEEVLIKRVIGVPGDKIALRNGQVIKNGRVLKEPYLKKTDECEPQRTDPLVPQNPGTPPVNYPLTVPDGTVFVMGDNRCDSQDSRVFGPIKQSSIVGRAFMIIWPFGRFTFLD